MLRCQINPTLCRAKVTDGNKPKTVIFFYRVVLKGVNSIGNTKYSMKKLKRPNSLFLHRFSVLKCGENLSLQSHPEKFYIGFFAQIFFGSLYASIGLRKKF